MATATCTQNRTYETHIRAGSTLGRFVAKDLMHGFEWSTNYQAPITAFEHQLFKSQADEFFDKEFLAKLKAEPLFFTQCMTGELGRYGGFKFLGVDMASKPDETMRWTISWPRNFGKTAFIQNLERERSRMYRELLEGLPTLKPNHAFTLSAPGRYAIRRRYSPNDTGLTSTVIPKKSEPRSTVMDRNDLISAMGQELRKHAQVEKELGDARRTITKHERTIECQGNRLKNTDQHLAQQMQDNDRQKRTIYSLEATIKEQLISLRRQEEQIANQRLVIEGYVGGKTVGTMQETIADQENRITNQAATIQGYQGQVASLERELRDARASVDRLNRTARVQYDTIAAIKNQAAAIGVSVLTSEQDAGLTSVRLAPVEPSFKGILRGQATEGQATTSQPRQAMNTPIAERAHVEVGGMGVVGVTPDEHLAYLRGMQLLGKRIQVWHLTKLTTNSGAGQWDDIRGKSDFTRPAHLYRVHPEDL